MKKILILLILLTSTLASASTISFAFNPDQESSQVKPGIIYSDSIVLQVTTPSRVLCRYSQTPEASFDSMEGVFDDNFETIHKKTLINLHDGVYKYYTKCRPINDLNNISAGTARLETIFTISNTISAQIILEETDLKAGKYEIKLLTTKVPTSTPQLQYSYDGITYSPIVLHGSEKSWRGFLVISSSLGEKVGSFKFEARDLEGRVGTGIVGDNIFIVDTKAPPLITALEASGQYGQIKLEWFLDEDEEIEEINIYRSESPNIDLTNLYETRDGDDEYYYDTNVKSGKTYYYRISSSDTAGNTAGLSREIAATSLLSETTTTSSTALNPSLIGSVDALLSEIGFLEIDIANSNSMISGLTKSEQDYMKAFRITDNFASAKSELTSLKRTVENYKTTDLTKELLENRLSSSRITLNILKKKIPQKFQTVDSVEITSLHTEDTIRKAILEYSPELSPNAIDKTIKNSLKLAEEESLQIKSKLNVFEITYLDGKRESLSIIEHSLNSQLERKENQKFLLQFPSGSLDLASLIIKNGDYTPEQEGLTSFKTDVKKITYTFNQKLEAQVLSQITISLIVTQEESMPLTGYFLSNVPTSGSSVATILIFIASIMVGYLLFIKQQQKKEISTEFLSRAHKVKVLQQQGKTDEADKLYDNLKAEYIGLSEDQKHEVFKGIKNLSGAMK